MRASDYARLDAQGHVYLDYTGGSLYATSQLDRHMALLHDHVLGNPHSSNPTSMAMTTPIGPESPLLSRRPLKPPQNAKRRPMSLMSAMVPMAVGVAAYFAAARALGVHELREVADALRRRRR